MNNPIIKLSIVPLLIISLLSSMLIGCINFKTINHTNAVIDVTSIDASSLNSSTLYSNSYDVVIISNDNVYINYSTANKSQKASGIYQYRSGNLKLVVNGEVSSIQPFGEWIYYVASKQEQDPKLVVQQDICRFNTITNKTEILISGTAQYIICAAGIFWINYYFDTDRLVLSQIKHANADGTNSVVLYSGERFATIGNMFVIDKYLYFSRSNGNRVSNAYQIDLKTGNISAPSQMQVWKVVDSKARFDQSTGKAFYQYERASDFVALYEGWAYFKSNYIWLDPDSGNYQLYAEQWWGGKIYKIKVDGTQRTEVNIIDSPETAYVETVQNGLIYYRRFVNLNNANIILRVQTDGSQTQTLLSTPCVFSQIGGKYLYYSYAENERDEQGNMYGSNLFRIGLEEPRHVERIF